METLGELTRRIAQPGSVTWIGLRPARRGPVAAVARAEIGPEGIAGDHGASGKRAVTLVQAEHLAVIGQFLGRPPVDPADLRRNIAVAGLNLLALRHREVRLGGAVLRITGPCAPCSRMQEAFGPGGYAAVRGHGGVTAAVVQPGPVALGDPVVPI